MFLEDMERKSRSNANTITAKEKGEKLIEILHEFGVEANLVQIHIGPSVTKFEIKPELGVRVNKISNLQKMTSRWVLRLKIFVLKPGRIR